jgi:hypothetical protein
LIARAGAARRLQADRFQSYSLYYRKTDGKCKDTCRILDADVLRRGFFLMNKRGIIPRSLAAGWFILTLNVLAVACHLEAP